ncbi:hypothetical protein SO802_023027 [Lithocarpus litseifolius]|uniref:Uncharacterized protein n=1 Tax=Lithocarpus litseifolius TaxID=425828 RepID=A0AAW2C547_9ROSI
MKYYFQLISEGWCVRIVSNSKHVDLKSIEHVSNYGTNYGSGDIRNSLLRYQLEVAIEEHDHASRIATLSANMLNEVVAHVVGDDEVDEPTRQHTGK